MGTGRRMLLIAPLVLAILLEGFLLLLVLELPFSPGFESWKLPSLWSQWQKNPNPQTEAAWKAERNRVWRMNLAFDAVIIVLTVANGFAIRHFVRKALYKP